MEKYSVLMSVYSKEKPEYLRASIDSMLSQTIPPDQFVLVKDGPLTNELNQVIDKFVNDNQGLFTIVELKENRGLGIALDEGMKYCKNELVARMDSDDISLPDRCEKELKLFEMKPELSIVSGFIGEFEDDPNHIVSVRDVPEEQEAIKRRMRTRSAFNHPAVMYKKSEVLRCGGYGTLRRKQDHVLFSHMMNSGCMAYNIQEILLLFRADRESVKRKKSWENCRGYIEAQMIIYRFGECSLVDYLYVSVSHLIRYILPEKLDKTFIMTFYRKSV